MSFTALNFKRIRIAEASTLPQPDGAARLLRMAVAGVVQRKGLNCSPCPAVELPRAHGRSTKHVNAPCSHGGGSPSKKLSVALSREVEDGKAEPG